MTIRRRLLIIFLSMFALMAFLLATNPRDLPLGLLLVPFILFGGLAFHLIRLFMSLFRYAANKPTRQRLVALIFAVILVNIAILQSVGQPTVQDIILGIAITAVVAIYVSKFQLSS